MSNEELAILINILRNNIEALIEENHLLKVKIQRCSDRIKKNNSQIEINNKNLEFYEKQLKAISHR